MQAAACLSPYEALGGIRGTTPDSKFHGANTGPIWGRQDPGGPHVGPMNFAIWGSWYNSEVLIQRRAKRSYEFNSLAPGKY